LKVNGLNDFCTVAGRKKRGPQNEGKSKYVVENKSRKNVTFWACEYVIENTVTYGFPQNMFMIIMVIGRLSFVHGPWSAGQGEASSYNISGPICKR
jgi:hypothetical protein